MTIANKTSRYVFQYESVPGEAAIIAVDSVCYEFGEYNIECGKWNTPYIKNDAIPYWVYASRTPTLIDVETAFPTFKHVFLPVTIQWLAWMLGNPADASPLVNVTALHEGKTYPLTIRHELSGGSNPTLRQAVGCYCIKFSAVAEKDKSFMVTLEFAWQKIEDQGDRPILTTPPLPAGELSDSYEGNPYVIWDEGGDNIEIPDVWRADIDGTKDYEIVSSDEGATQTVNPGKLQPVEITLQAIFETNDLWDKYIDRNIKNMSITVKKHNTTNYQKLIFYNCRVITYVDTGNRDEGHYNSVCVLKGEMLTGSSDFFTEGGTDYANHFKAKVT